MTAPRYRVEIVGWLSRESRFARGWLSMEIDVTQTFTRRDHAERFAREISRYLPATLPNDVPDAWVLVYALPDGSDPWAPPNGHCYLSFDPGGVEVKRHAIFPGCYGGLRHVS